MKITIIYKKDKVKNKSVVPNMISAFEKRGHSVNTLYSGTELKDSDYAIVLGGDGALLHTAIVAAKQNIPVMGINFGTLGFLSELEPNDAQKAVDIILGEHNILERTMLKITLDGKEFYALNECVIQRDYSKPYGNQVVEIGVVFNGKKAMDYVLDGIAIATPTGSTAYSLSAGGSILAPDAKVFSVTPICALSLCARPIVISDETEVSFSLNKQKDPLRLYADGRPIGTVTQESKLLIQKAPYTASFVTMDKDKLFSALTKKLVR